MGDGLEKEANDLLLDVDGFNVVGRRKRKRGNQEKLAAEGLLDEDHTTVPDAAGAVLNLRDGDWDDVADAAEAGGHKFLDDEEDQLQLDEHERQDKGLANRYQQIVNS